MRNIRFSCWLITQLQYLQFLVRLAMRDHFSRIVSISPAIPRVVAGIEHHLIRLLSCSSLRPDAFIVKTMVVTTSSCSQTAFSFHHLGWQYVEGADPCWPEIWMEFYYSFLHKVLSCDVRSPGSGRKYVGTKGGKPGLTYSTCGSSILTASAFQHAGPTMLRKS